MGFPKLSLVDRLLYMEFVMKEELSPKLRKDSFLAPQARGPQRARFWLGGVETCAQLLPASPGPSTRGFRVLGGSPGFGLLGRNAAERTKSY